MLNDAKLIAASTALVLLTGSFAFGQEKLQWFRGNTHTHTVICGHADSAPNVVAKWYHDKGYNFLILSEHNHFIDPTTVTIEGNRRDDFILIPGIELTEKVHSTCMNVKGLVKTEKYPKDITVKKIIASQVDRTREQGGEMILNHPNFHWVVVREDIHEVKSLRLFELYNGHPTVQNFGDDKHPSTENMWDFSLTRGRVLYGVSSDDAHQFKAESIKPSASNPGRGWVMVQAAQLHSDAITKAMVDGHFYSSSGVFLETCQFDSDGYSVSIDLKKTMDELKSPILRGRKIQEGIEGFRIEWISKDGAVLSTDRALTARYSGKKSDMYIRPKIVYTRQHPTEGWEEYYAWGQPQFLDGRQ